MDKKYIFFIFSLFFSVYLPATNDNASLGARQNALASNDLFIQNVWAAHNNPALLGTINQMQTGIFYQNRFLLKQLGLKAVAFVLPLNNSALGLTFSSFGYSIFQENQLKLSYGMKLGEKVNAGVGLSWLNNQINGIEYVRKYNFILPEMALMYQVTKNLTIATSVYNPVMQKIKSSRYDERLPTVFKLGGRYTLSDKVILYSQINKDLDFDASVRAGMEYFVSEKLILNMGIATTATLAAFGVSYRLNDWGLNFGTSYHQQLGFSPSVGIVYRKNK